MNKVIILFVSIFVSMPLLAADSDAPAETNSWSAKYKKSPFGLGIDLQTKSMWRGMEMMPQNSSPVIFPCCSYSIKGLYLYAMGG